MSEQSILNKCTDAFFYLEKGNVPAPIQDWKENYSLDALKRSANDPQKLQAQENLVKDLGLPSSGSLLIDRSLAARECGQLLKADDKKNQADKLADSAEEMLSKAILQGQDKAFLVSIGKGVGRLANTTFEPPALDQYQKSILEKVNKNPVLSAQVENSEYDKSEFYIVVSQKKK